FKTCDKELMKVNSFYSEKLTEANRRLVLFGIIALDSSAQEMGGDNYANLHLHAYKPTLRKKSELHKLKTAAGDVYLSLVFLQSYQEINYKALHKIMKKYDAKFECEHGLQWKTERLDASVLHTERNHCGQMMFRLETFMLQLEGGNKQKSMRRLKVPPRVKEQVRTRRTRYFDLDCESSFPVCLHLIIRETRSESQMEPLVPLLQLYRGSFLLVEFLYLLGLSIWFWRRSGINHVLIFELDPRRHLSHQHVLEVAGFLAVCWCASMLACLHPSLLSVPQQLHPLFLHSLLLLLLLNPTPTCHSRSCRWLLAVMVRFLTAPFRPVGFAECWLADQLNSLSPLLLSLWDMLCFYTSQINWQDLQAGYFLYRVTCLIQCFPPWLRFTQCLRQYWDSNNTLHLLNAGKYSTVLLMVTFASLYNAAVELSVYLYLWAMATCMSVLVTVSWDLRMDWGLLQGNGLLKEELLFSREVNFTPFCRRSLWNLFRLENEQLKNCERCRAVRDFDFPVNLPEQFLQEKLMDQDEMQNDHHKVRVQHFSLQRTVLFSVLLPTLCSRQQSHSQLFFTKAALCSPPVIVQTQHLEL
uniref:Uncharacterized protein n=1 Tax=Astyanax mexicanus TaxID=7994 RepID=W5KK34_ASTMX